MTPNKYRHRNCGFLLSVMPAIALAGCQGAQQAPEQVVAQGEDFELTVHEYDLALRQSPPVTAEAVQPMRKAILEALIDEKLLAAKAQAHDLDEAPDIAQELQAAQRAILAKAFVRKLTGGAYRPSEADLRYYYDEHPLQFADRKRLVVSEVILKSDTPNIREHLASFEENGLEGLASAGKMSGHTTRNEPIRVVRFSDDIIGPAVANVPRLTVGSQVVYQTVGQVHLGQIEELADDPVSFDEARPSVTAGLIEERNKKLVRAALKKERDERKVAVVSNTLKTILGKTSMVTR